MPDLVPFHIDLAGWEQERVATVLTGAGDLMDLHGMYWDEADATQRLYGGLDAEQRAVYQQLVDAGVMDAARSTS